MWRFRASPLVALLALAPFFGCSRGENAAVRSESAAGITADTLESDVDRPSAESLAAQALLTELADRTEALLEMARVAVTRREQLAVSAAARRILSEQRRESNRVLGMLKGEYHVTHRPSITEQEQALVDSVKGSGVGEFDRIFLGVVAQHHEDDVRLIDRALPAIEQPRVRELMSTIRAQRASEAAEFRKRLGQASGGS